MAHNETKTRRELIEPMPQQNFPIKSSATEVEKILANDANLSASCYNPHSIESEELLKLSQHATEIKALLSNCCHHIDSLLDEAATTSVRGEIS